MAKSKINAIVVLGGGLKKDGKRWRTANFEERDNFGVMGDRIRIDAANYLYRDYKKSDFNPLVIVSGSKGQLASDPDAPTLAEVLFGELVEMGVPAEAIYKEDKSGNTYQQLKELEKLVLKFDLGEMAIISNDYHQPRVQAMIECVEELANLRAKLKDGSLVLKSAEGIVIGRDRNRWEEIISNAYAGEAIKARIKLEKQGVEQIRSGTYKLK